MNSQPKTGGGCVSEVVGRRERSSVLSLMKMMVFSFEPFLGSAMYVEMPPISSVRPFGLPSWTLPDRQHEPIPTF